MWTRPIGQLMIFSNMPAGQGRAASDGDIVLDTRHSAVIRKIAHFGPYPQGIFRAQLGPLRGGCLGSFCRRDTGKGDMVKVMLLKNIASSVFLHMEVYQCIRMI